MIKKEKNLYVEQDRSLTMWAVICVAAFVVTFVVLIYSVSSYNEKRENCYMNASCPAGTHPQWYPHHEVCKCQ